MTGSRFVLDECGVCEDVPTKCRLCESEYSSQVQARVCELRHQPLTVGQVARRLGIAPATWRAYVSRGQAPKPDGHHDARTPYWFASTIQEYRPKS